MRQITDILLRGLTALQGTSSEAGASMAEYGLLLALVAVVAIGALTSVGSGVVNKFTSVASNLT